MGEETSIKVKFSNSITGKKKLEEYAKTLQGINAVLEGINVGKSKQVDEMTKKGTTSAKNMSKEFKDAFDVAKFLGFVSAVKRAVSSLSSLTKESANYIENINLLEVAYKRNNQSVEESTKSVKEFVNTMSDVYGLDESRLVRSLGIFKQLSNAMQLPVETGEKLSELMVKMTNDISSLYNLDLTRAENALQSALVGQVRPIRGATGADITEKTLQGTLDQLGIDRNIRDLSFAEKRLTMVISLSRQLKVSQGDYGRTIESTTNQMRIFSEQWSRLARGVGNIFLPILQKVLPYVNAIMMVLVEIANLVAGLLGFEMPQFDYSGLAGTSDATSDLIEGMDSASESAKKLKSGLRGFDKLNNITTSSGTGGGGGGSGIDSRLQDAFNKSFESYNDMLGEVKMKANDIRDSIMEWLGFTKEIDKETGKVTFKFEKITSGTVLGSLAVGGTIYSGIASIVKLLNTFGLTAIKLPSIFSLLSTVISGAITIIGTVATAIAGFLGVSLATLGLIVVGIGAVVAVIYVFRDEILNFFIGLFDNFNTYIVQPMLNFFGSLAKFVLENVVKPIIEYFKPMFDAVFSVVYNILTNLYEIMSGIINGIISIGIKMAEIVFKLVEIFIALGSSFYKYVIKPIIDFVLNFAKTIYNNALKPIIDFFISFADFIYKKVVKPIFDTIKWLRDQIFSVFKTVGIAIGDFIGGAIKSVINGVFFIIESSINGFIKLLNGAIGIINGIPGVNITKVNEFKIPRLKTGMDFVPNDYYPAYLDYGERVLTKEENRDYTTALNSGSKDGVLGKQITNATIVVQVGDEEIARKVLKDLNEMAKSNGEPIRIGG